ncbi:MAG: serine/threonine-protein kinase, partial [Arenimonas sp.]
TQDEDAAAASAPARLPEAIIAEPAFPQVGERLGNYELLRPLQAGGMGVVYLGRRADDVYEQQVAIKLVRPTMLAQADFRRQLISRFEDERSILARMSHPNVARILDGGSTAGGIPYLVMEYVEGVSLTDYCKAQALDVRARLALFAKVCDGVQEAHRHLIVHRDLKPDNILVGENGEPRLLDFGIAKILEQEPRQVDGEPTSLSAMTPAYASPEQVRQQALTTSSDVYSLGVVLYQLLAGVRPYELASLRPAEAERMVCETIPETLVKSLERAPLSIAGRRTRRAQLSPDLERIVAKAMHKEASRRYGSAQEFADDIRRYLDGQPVQASPDSSLYRIGKFVRRHRIGAIAASLALLAILSATATAFWQADQARRAADDTVRVNNFLMDVLKSSDPYEAGSEITMSQAVDLASATIATRFPGRPDLSSKVRYALGYSMISRYKLDTAERELGLALTESRTAFGADDIHTLYVREAIAQLRQEQDRLPEAQAMLRGIIAEMDAHGLQSEPLYGIAMGNLGDAYLRAEDYRHADEVLRRAAALPPPNPSSSAAVDHAALIANLAQAAHGLGDVERADGLYQQAQRENEGLHPQGSPEIAIILNNRAQLLQEAGQKEEAFALWKKSADMREQVFGGDHPMLVTALTDVARQALRLEKYDYAVAQSSRAVAMADRLDPAPNRNAIMARTVWSGALLMSKNVLGSGDVISQAEKDLAGLKAPDEDMVAVVEYIRTELCKRPRTPAVPSCAGIASSEPAQP